jgi:hypothetical protein
MAVQLWLGILSVRRARPRLAHPAHLGADGTNLAIAPRRKLPHRGECKRGAAYVLMKPCQRTKAGCVVAGKKTPLAVVPLKWSRSDESFVRAETPL